MVVRVREEGNHDKTNHERKSAAVYKKRRGRACIAGAAVSARRETGPREDLFLITSWLLASELALGLGAQSRSLALPRALGLLAQRGAVGFGRRAGGSAYRRSAHRLARRAALELAHLLGAANRAHGLLAVDLTLGTLRLRV